MYVLKGDVEVHPQQILTKSFSFVLYSDSYLDLHTAMDHVEEVDYGFAWTDEEIDGRSSGVCDLLTDDDENDDSL